MPWRRKGKWRHSSTILDLGITWRWVVSFTPQPLYPRYPLYRRQGVSQSGCCGEEKNMFPLLGIEPGISVIEPVTRRCPGSIMLLYSHENTSSNCSRTADAFSESARIKTYWRDKTVRGDNYIWKNSWEIDHTAYSASRATVWETTL
jgi:hypothetical protein